MAKKEKISIFDSARAKVSSVSKSSKDDKEVVYIDGLESKLLELEFLKAQVKDLTAQEKAINDEVKEISREKFVELYQANKENPNTFLIKDGEGCVMVIPTDSYKKIEDRDRANQLIEEYGEDVITIEEKYYFNTKVLERNMAAVEKLIMDAKTISDDDKRNLLLPDIKYSITKGYIDKLSQYGSKMQTVIDDIQPTIALKNCGGKMEEGGMMGDDFIGNVYDNEDDGTYRISYNVGTENFMKFVVKNLEVQKELENYLAKISNKYFIDYGEQLEEDGYDLDRLFNVSVFADTSIPQYVTSFTVPIDDDITFDIDNSIEEKFGDLVRLVPYYYKRGGSVDGRSTRAKNTWNRGGAWTRDRNAHNKSEDWEKPMNKRKYAEGGGVDSIISEIKMKYPSLKVESYNNGADISVRGKIKNSIYKLQKQYGGDVMEDYETDELVLEFSVNSYAKKYRKLNYFDNESLMRGVVIKKKFSEGGGVDSIISEIKMKYPSLKVESYNNGADISVRGKIKNSIYKLQEQYGGDVMEDYETDDLVLEFSVNSIPAKFGEVYNEVVNVIMTKQNISYDEAVDIINNEEMEAWLRNMVEYHGETDANFLAEQILTTDEGKYAKGGRVPRNVGRDWIFKSKQKWEQDYDRKREYKEYKKEGWLANWFKDGGGVGTIDLVEKDGNDFVTGTKDLKTIVDSLKEIDFELDGSTYDIIDVKENGLKAINTANRNEIFIRWENINDRKFPNEEGVMFGYNNWNNYFYFKLTNEERAEHPYNNWMHEKADMEDRLRDIEDSMMKNGGNVGRDWLFKSKQDWEQKYDRKREWKEYKKEGWFANWFKDGGETTGDLLDLWQEMGGEKKFQEEKNYDYGSDLTDEAMVKNNLVDGEISADTLKRIVGCELSYPYQIVGAIKLQKCFMRPYYKLS